MLLQMQKLLRADLHRVKGLVIHIADGVDMPADGHASAL